MIDWACFNISLLPLAMESNIAIFHNTKNRTMAFRGAVKPERWNQILIPMDDMTRFAMNKALGEGVFEYRFT